EEEGRVLRVRELEPEEELEIDRQAERLRHAEVDPFAAIRRAGVLRLLQLAVRHGEARAGRRPGRLQVAGDVRLVAAGEEAVARWRRRAGAGRDIDGQLVRDV